MSTTGRRILTAKTMALAVMAIVFAVVAIWHRRRLDAGTADHRSHSPSSGQRVAAAPHRNTAPSQTDETASSLARAASY